MIAEATFSRRKPPGSAIGTIRQAGSAAIDDKPLDSLEEPCGSISRS